VPEAPRYPADAALRERLRVNLQSFDVVAADAEGLRKAAVAVAVVGNEREEARFVFTERSSKLTHHAGQFALPGGRIDPGETPERTALRELEEEVGLRVAEDGVLGRLDDFTTRSGFVMTPVVVWGGPPGRLEGNPGEVEAVHEIPLAVLDGPDVPHLETIPESDRPVLSIPLGDGESIWTPAGAILYQLREVGLHGRHTRVSHFEQPLFAWR
jgi:mutator protein MutT